MKRLIKVFLVGTVFVAFLGLAGYLIATSPYAVHIMVGLVVLVVIFGIGDAFVGRDG